MKSCIGCKYLVAHRLVCSANEHLSRTKDALTGQIVYVNLNFPDDMNLQPRSQDMRKEGERCGPGRKLYEPTLLARMFPKMYN